MLEAKPAIDHDPIRHPGLEVKEITGLIILSMASRNPPANWPIPGYSIDWQSGRLLRLGADQSFWMGQNQLDCPSSIYVTDQSDSWATIDISGSSVIATLERLCPLDLASWSDGMVSRTIIEHMSAIVLKKDETSFTLMTPRSTAKGFWHALMQQTLRSTTSNP